MLTSLLSTFSARPALAQDGSASPLETPIDLALLDRDAFCQWVDGREIAVPETEAKGGPRDVVWTRDGRVEWRGVRFGEAASPGVRHLRIGLLNPIAIGAVLVRGGGRLSVLKPDAEYPGNLGDDAQWLPAERIEGRAWRLRK